MEDDDDVRTVPRGVVGQVAQQSAHIGAEPGRPQRLHHRLVQQSRARTARAGPKVRLSDVPLNRTRQSLRRRSFT
jgi:hypothetical protein